MLKSLKVNDTPINFLSGNQQCVVVKDSKSDIIDVTTGVSQGSVLGSLLLLLFINDMPTEVNSTLL